MSKVLLIVISVTLASQALAARGGYNPANETFLERSKQNQLDGSMGERLYRLHTLAKEFYTIVEVEVPPMALLQGAEGELAWVSEKQTNDILPDMQNETNESHVTWDNPKRSDSSSALVKDMEQQLKGLLETASKRSPGPASNAVRTFEKGLKTLEQLSLEVQKAHEDGGDDSKIKHVLTEGFYGEQFPYNV